MDVLAEIGTKAGWSCTSLFAFHLGKLASLKAK